MVDNQKNGVNIWIIIKKNFKKIQFKNLKIKIHGNYVEVMNYDGNDIKNNKKKIKNKKRMIISKIIILLIK